MKMSFDLGLINLVATNLKKPLTKSGLDQLYKYQIW